MGYAVHLLIQLCVYIILALSLNLIVGYCGLLSLSHATFFAVGSYTYAFVVLKFGFAFPAAISAAIILPATLGLLFAIPAATLRGDAFVLLTLATQAMCYGILLNWHDPSAEWGSLHNMTNGLYGIGGIPQPIISGITFDTIDSAFVIGVLLTGIVLLTVRLLTRSPWARALQCMRDDELALRSLGKSARDLKYQVTFISAGLAGAAGGLYALHAGYVDPSLGSLNQSMIILAMLLIGGTGNFRGPIIGAALLLAIPEVLRILRIPESNAGEIRLLAYGLLLVLAMHFRPQGIAGSYRLD